METAQRPTFTELAHKSRASIVNQADYAAAVLLHNSRASRINSRHSVYGLANARPPPNIPQWIQLYAMRQYGSFDRE